MTFDGPNKLVILTSATLDLQVLWSNWKDWLIAGNAGHALAFDTVGGEPIDPTEGTLVPLYLFIQNGWKIRPMEADHTLRVIKGSLVVSGGGYPFVPTLGDFTVQIPFMQPVQAIGYSTSGGAGPSLDAIAAAVWQHILEGGFSAEALQRILLAALAGTSERTGNTITFTSPVDGSTIRITGSFDAQNNRTGVILDGD